MKQKILEYFNGNPDSVFDDSNYIDYAWTDDDTVAFGFYPIDLNGTYEFLFGERANHMTLANNAALKIVGRAIGHISEEYISDWMMMECYDSSYGKGRIWKDGEIISFWAIPSYKVLETVVSKLGIDPDDYMVVGVDETLQEFMDNILEGNFEKYEDIFSEGWETEGRKYRIDNKVADIIRSYNQPSDSWQSQREKEGWKSLAQRNATLYQENRQRVDEFFQGDPDTVREYDDDTNDNINTWYYGDPGVISFGFFQTSLDGEKEFIHKLDISHYDISGELAKKIVGKAIASEDMTDHEMNYIKSSIYQTSAYKGRVFLEPKIITTWSKVSSEKLAELIDLLGGIDKYADYTYLYGIDETNVMNYINSNETTITSYEEDRMKSNITKWLDDRIVEIIRNYNSPNSTLAAKTSKLGNMTIAQYNSLKYQEGKEPKQTIKENDINMKNNKYQEEFSNYISIMTEALQKEDYKAYDYVKEMLDEAVEDSKHEKELMNEMNTTNFGVLNHIFESELPTLIKTNKKAVKKVINTIKEDKNLLGEFNFYNLIKQYNGKIAEDIKSDLILSKINEAAWKSVDKKTVLKSNQKLKKVMMENNIIPSDFVDADSKKLYEAGHVILTKPSTLTNLYETSNSFNTLRKYMDDHKDDKKSSKDVETLVKEFEEKLKNNLNESEMSFVQQITDFRSPIAEQRKEKLFNKFKNECIDKINTMLKEDANNDELKALSEQISEMQFNKESIVKDIAKLLEIRDILMDD